MRIGTLNSKGGAPGSLGLDHAKHALARSPGIESVMKEAAGY